MTEKVYKNRRSPDSLAKRMIDALIKAYECGLRSGTVAYIVEVGIKPFLLENGSNDDEVSTITLTGYINELSNVLPRVRKTSDRMIINVWRPFCGVALYEVYGHASHSRRVIALNIEALEILSENWLKEKDCGWSRYEALQADKLEQQLLLD